MFPFEFVRRTPRYKSIRLAKTVSTFVIENQFQWFLDGAHSEMSVVIAAEWFLQASKM
jgi:hypothetical protein